MSRSIEKQRAKLLVRLLVEWSQRSGVGQADAASLESADLARDHGSKHLAERSEVVVRNEAGQLEEVRRNDGKRINEFVDVLDPHPLGHRRGGANHDADHPPATDRHPVHGSPPASDRG